MGRRVFISFLGTGKYGACYYKDPKSEYRSASVRFIQEATLELVGAQKWASTDVAYVMVTEKSYSTNWICNGQVDSRTKEVIEQEGLEKRLNAMQLPFAVQSLQIPEGNNEAEIWTIFESIFAKLEEGDELYFDITHGFRYLPMLFLVLSNYAKFLKNIKVPHLSYGNWESRNQQTNEAPIIDLTPLTALQDWTTAAGDFIEFGSAKRIAALIKDTIDPVLKESKGKSMAAHQLRGVSIRLQEVSGMLNTCRGYSIVSGESVAESSKLLENLEQELIRPLNPLLEKVRSRLNQFAGRDNLMNGLVAARWCLDNGMVQQSITITYESLLSLVCELGEMDYKDSFHRNIASSTLRIVSSKELREDSSRWKAVVDKEGDGSDYSINKYATFVASGLLAPFDKPYNQLLNLRNDINHGGMVDKVIPQGDFEIRMKRLLDEFTPFFTLNKVE